jgi:hypothetical protein
VDGRLVGQAPLSQQVFMEPGKRVVEARLEGHDDALRTVDIEKGSTQEVHLVLAPKIGGRSATTTKSGKSIAIIAVGAGLGVAGIGTGIGLLVAASGKRAESDKSIADGQLVAGDCPGGNVADAAACTKLKEQLRSEGSFTNAGVGLLVAGGVLAAGTVVYALWPKKQGAPTTGQILPVVTPTFAGFAATGQF